MLTTECPVSKSQGSNTRIALFLSHLKCEQIVSKCLISTTCLQFVVYEWVYTTTNQPHIITKPIVGRLITRVFNFPVYGSFTLVLRFLFDFKNDNIPTILRQQTVKFSKECANMLVYDTSETTI